MYVVNGPNRDQDLYVPIQGFTIRVSDKAVLQTWPSNTDQVTTQHNLHLLLFLLLLVCFFVLFATNGLLKQNVVVVFCSPFLVL